MSKITNDGLTQDALWLYPITHGNLGHQSVSVNVRLCILYNGWLNFWLSLSLSKTLSWTIKSGLRPKFNLTSV